MRRAQNPGPAAEIGHSGENDFPYHIFRNVEEDFPGNPKGWKMATIKTRSGSLDAIDGGSLEAAGGLGVLFGCHRGVCGKCATDIAAGMENLSERTDEELAMALDPDRRLMCQCRILKGTVELDLP